MTTATTRAADRLGHGAGGAGTPLPAGFGIEMDVSTRVLSDGSLFGGSPARVMRLTAAGSTALAELRPARPGRPRPGSCAVTVRASDRCRDIARPAAAGDRAPSLPPETVPPETVPPETVPPETPPETVPPETVPPAAVTATVTVVIPVRDRAAMLDRCLAAAGRQYPVLVVDDGSQDPGAIAAVAEKHGATSPAAGCQRRPGRRS